MNVEFKNLKAFKKIFATGNEPVHYQPANIILRRAVIEASITKEDGVAIVYNDNCPKEEFGEVGYAIFQVERNGNKTIIEFNGTGM